MDLNNASEVMKNFSAENGMPVGVDTAIKALRPGCTFEIAMSGGVITYHKWHHPDGLSAPTKAEIDEELVFQEKLAKHYQYAYDRCRYYPDGFEQLDMLWHAIDNGTLNKTSDFYTAIKAVKDAHPKE